MLDRRQFLRARPAPQPAPAARPAAARPVSDLRPFVATASDPWDDARARHLLRRVSLAARPGDVAALVRLAPDQAVQRIVDAARTLPALSDPAWIGLRHPGYNDQASQAQRDAYNRSNSEAVNETLQGVQNRLLGGGLQDRFGRLGTALRERLAMAWAGHYVAELRSYNHGVWNHEYLAVLHRSALGRVPEMVREIGLTSAMLQYLNGNQNRKQAPNENYAREVLELFTMGITGPDGVPNYSQQDVTELSRALTGWRTDARREDTTYFEERSFDPGDKTVFGRTGPWGYDDVIPILFEERGPEIAHFIALALYRAFVTDVTEPDPGVVAALADEIEGADFSVEPAIRALLQSAHFYDDAFRGALIKTPAELLLGTLEAFGVGTVDVNLGPRQTPMPQYLKGKMRDIGQELFNPPDVSGWDGGTAWIDTSSFPERVTRLKSLFKDKLGATAIDHALARPSATPGDQGARALALDLATDLLPRPPAAGELEVLTEVLVGGAESYAWVPGENRDRILLYLEHLVSLPEYQLR